MSNCRRKSRKPQRRDDFDSSAENFQQSTGPEIAPVDEIRLGGTTISSSTAEDSSSLTINLNSSSQGESEMSVLDVLQGLRQNFISECTLCPLQMKDWQSTFDHIHEHRMSYIPGCVGISCMSKRGISCIWCRSIFSGVSELIAHIHSKHSFVAKHPFTCPFCKKMFDTCSDAQQHFDIKCIHMKCPVCSAVYDQEYKLFSHLVVCLRNFHPHLETLICHVCQSNVALSSLSDHMIVHSFSATAEMIRRKDEEESHTHDKSESLSATGKIFLCEVCDKRFTIFEDFQKHLVEHSNLNDYCPLCFLKGFSCPDFKVRHLLLRCPKRSPKQISIASRILSAGKEEGLYFFDVIWSLRHDGILLDACQAWSSIKFVVDFMNKYITAPDSQLESYYNRSSLESLSDCPLPSDMELLSWLSKYEARLELGELSLASDSSKDMASWIPPKNVSKAEYGAMLATFYKSINESKNSQSPTCFTVKNPSMNAEIKITAVSPNESQQVLHEYNMANDSPPCLPSLDFIRKNYPGVVLLPEVDLENLRKVANEAEKEKRRDWVKEAIRSGRVTQDDLFRLEMEAQYLRELEPFYTVLKPTLEFSVLRKGNKILENEPYEPDPEHLKALLEEAQDLMKHDYIK